MRFENIFRSEAIRVRSMVGDAGCEAQMVMSDSIVMPVSMTV